MGTRSHVVHRKGGGVSRFSEKEVTGGGGGIGNCKVLKPLLHYAFIYFALHIKLNANEMSMQRN